MTTIAQALLASRTAWLLWGRIALRFGPLDFKPTRRDGLGYDWPIDYADLAPWYDRVERLIGVTGNPSAPAFYVMFGAVVGLGAAAFLVDPVLARRER